MIVIDFVTKIYSFYGEGFSPYMQQISLQYLVLFKNYTDLNLRVHFS